MVLLLLWSHDFFLPLHLDPRFRPLLLKFINASFLNHLWSLGSVFYAFLLHSLAFWRDALAPSARLAKNPQDYAVGEDFSDPCDK